MVALIRSSKPVFPKEDIDLLLEDIGKVLIGGQFRDGKNVSDFENQVAQYIGVKGAVAFDSDSSSFETILRYFDVGGKEVVVCTNSFISVPNSVVAAGGKVVFADINSDTLSMDPKSLKQNVTENTKGVIVTHIAGFPNPDLTEIAEFCRKNNYFLVEDATHALGAKIFEQKAGSFGDAAVLAFTPTKVLTTGEGGMLVSNNAELCEFSKRFSFYGSGMGKTNFVDLGRHMVLPEISAVLGIHQLRQLEKFISKRNMIAECYDKAFKNVGLLKIVECPSGYRSSYYKYPVTLDAKIDREQFAKALLEEFGVETGNVFYPPCHMQGVYKKLGFNTFGS